MKFEFSAGGVVYRKTEKGLEILVAQHSQHKGWVFPKGLIGDHPSTGSGQVRETKEEAAVREVEEETGARAEIVEAIKPVTYWYVLNKEKIRKTVYYFIMEYKSGDITKHDFEMADVKWVEADKALGTLTYKSDKDAFREAFPIIKKLAKR